MYSDGIMNENQLFTITQLAKITGLSTHTLRFYEDVGILRYVIRLKNGRRRYTVDHLYWLEFVMRLRSTNMSISDIHRYADLMEKGSNTTQKRLEILLHHQNQVEAQIANLQLSLYTIKQKVAYYKSVNMPDAMSAEENNHQFHLCFAPDSPIETAQQLPDALHDFLTVRNVQKRLELAGEDNYNLDWPYKYLFAIVCSLLYDAFPDFAWNPSNFRRQGSIWSFTVNPTGKHTRPLKFEVPVKSYNIPPTGLELPIFEGSFLARVENNKVIELCPEFSESPEVILLNFAERIVEGSYP